MIPAGRRLSDSTSAVLPRLSTRGRQRERAAVPELRPVQRGAHPSRLGQPGAEAAQHRELQASEHQEDRVTGRRTASSSSSPPPTPRPTFDFRCAPAPLRSGRLRICFVFVVFAAAADGSSSSETAAALLTEASGPPFEGGEQPGWGGRRRPRGTPRLPSVHMSIDDVPLVPEVVVDVLSMVCLRQGFSTCTIL